jgi:hypothetical protein
MDNNVVYYVDIPRYDCDDGTWINVAICFTRKEAEQILLDRYGIQADQTDCFIVVG